MKNKKQEVKIIKIQLNFNTKLIFVVDCVLYAVGKPVYHRYTEQAYGWWMRDPNPQNEKIDGEKYWFTKEDDAYHLFYYDNKSLFRKDTHKYKNIFKDN